MKHGMFIATVFSTALLFAYGCAESKDQNTQAIHSTIDFKISRRFNLITPQSTPTIQVFNQANQPVANAQIMIGDSLGNPFVNNFITTDENGSASITEWTEAAHITVDAPGYIRQTLLSQKPGAFQIKLGTSYLAARPVVKGQVTGLPVNNGDKHMDFSLVLPTIAKADLLNFNLDSVISPYTDTIDIILGQQAELPSNVSMPTQKESYALLPVTISKPEHRVYALTYGPKTYFALSGRFPFKTVIGEMQDGKEFYEIVNHFAFTAGGLRETTITGPNTELNIPGTEIKFSGQVGIKGATIQADEVALSLTVNDLSGGRFIPSDVKRLDPTKEMKLNIISGKPTYVVTLLKKKTDFSSDTADVADRSSASMLPHTAGMQTSLLPLMNGAPTVSEANGGYKITIPPSTTTTLDSKSVNPIAVSIAISNINVVQDGQQTVKMLDRKWEVLGTAWPEEVNLPAWPLDTESIAPATKRRFEINLIGSQTSGQTDLGDDMVKAATHVTHAAAEL